MFITFKKLLLSLIWVESPLSISKTKERWKSRREEGRRKYEGANLPQFIQVSKRHIILSLILIGKYIFFSLKAITGRPKLQILVSKEIGKKKKIRELWPMWKKVGKEKSERWGKMHKSTK